MSSETPPTSPPEADEDDEDEPLVLTTPAQREAIVQELRRDMLRGLVQLVNGVEKADRPEADELQAFRELCKDYESPGSLQLEALESRIQTLENLASATEVNTQRDTIMMGP